MSDTYLGNWYFSRFPRGAANAGEENYGIYRSDGQHVATTRSRAYAQAICALPDLLAAMEQVIGEQAPLPDCPGCGGHTGHCARCPVAAAIKARDRAQGAALAELSR